MTNTLEAIAQRYEIEIPASLARQIEVPILSGQPQRQGDVFVEPITSNAALGGDLIPSRGIAVVSGENGGHTHLLLPDGLWRPSTASSPTDMSLGTLTVEEGCTAYLWHPEHGMVGFGPGTYRAVRQRTATDSIRAVQD